MTRGRFTAEYYQAQLARGGAPVTDVIGAAHVLQGLFDVVAPFDLQPVDAELGVWNTTLPELDAAQLNEDGYLTLRRGEYQLVAETP